MTLRALASSVGFVSLALGLGGCAGALREDPGPLVGVPGGGVLETDIRAGYRAYGPTLERWGRWSADPLYAMRWCPRDVDPTTFVPYRSKGRWAPSEATRGGAWGAPPGAPYWLSDDAETWGDITMHHGWWVHLDEATASGVWCWVPGAAETAGRVVWRVADGFVGWAPEPPTYVDDDSLDYDNLRWAFELVGSLFEQALDDGLLTGDAADMAYRATYGGGHDPARPGAPRTIGPTSEQVADARRALAGYVAAHPVVSAPVATATQGQSTATPTVGSTSTARSSSQTAQTTEDALPPGMALYAQLMRDPLMGSGGFGLSPYLPVLGGMARAVPGVHASTVVPSSSPPTSSAPTSHSSSHGGSSHASSSGSSSSSGKSHGK
jgi:hypothetical protein